MRRLALAGSVLLVAVLAATAFGIRSGPSTARAKAHGQLTPMQQRLLSGAASTFLDQQAAKQGLGAAEQLDDFTPTTVTGCPANRRGNVRVNQECLNLTDPDLSGRGQAQNETSIAQDPSNPDLVVASMNDYRRGDGNCEGYVSANTGRRWRDSTVPSGFTRGTAFGGAAREYWQAGGDTSVDFDTKGNAYLSCQVFNRGTGVSPNPDQSSAFYVFRTSGNSVQQRGASWTFPGRPVAESDDTAGTGAALLDKQLLTVDNHVGSPFQDRIYVTWTFFAPDGTGYIFEAHSSDYGEHFSDPVVVSGDSPLCTQTFKIATPHGRCNENQDSQPFTGPDGALYVAWANFNNDTAHAPAGEEPGDDDGGGDAGVQADQAAPADNHNQMLLAKSTDGGQTFSPPVLVSNYYELPDCATYQNGADPGRSCVPEKNPTADSIFRATNYPVGAVNPRNPKQVVVTFGSYINQHSNEANGCVPTGINLKTGINLYDGVKVAGACNNDIVVSRSDDAGATFTGASTNVRALPATRTRDRRADQWFQWADFDPRGRLAVSFYDRGYGDDEQTGFSDFSVAGSRNLTKFATDRATSGSMPPPTQFGGIFWGDYTGMTAEDGVLPLWSDTRDLNITSCRAPDGSVTLPPQTCTYPGGVADRANDQNGYTRRTRLPLP